MQSPRLFEQKDSDPTYNAQYNLMGRTHYVDPDTLRFHKSRVIRASVHDSGLLFSIVSSDALDYQGTKRGFRYAIFDIFGTCLDRPDLEHAYRTSEQASKARYTALNAINAFEHTMKAAEEYRASVSRDLDYTLNQVRALAEKQAA